MVELRAFLMEFVYRVGGERIFGFAVQTRYNAGFVRVLYVPIHGLHFLPGTWVTLGHMGDPGSVITAS